VPNRPNFGRKIPPRFSSGGANDFSKRSAGEPFRPTDPLNVPDTPKPRSYARMLDHSPTFVTRTLPSGCPRTDTLSSRAAAYKPERNRLRLRSSMPMAGTSKC